MHIMFFALYFHKRIYSEPFKLSLRLSIHLFIYSFMR